MRDKSQTSDENSAVDAVFVIGTGSKHDNEELKYALRNLEKNCPFVRRVYISGECPSWVDKRNVVHIQYPDRFTHAKDANIVDKLRRACEEQGIASRILFCSDDQFQTRVCTWEDFSPRWLRKFTPDDTWYDDKKRVWHTRLRKTLLRAMQRKEKTGHDPSKTFYWQPHIWMQIDRDAFIDYANWCDYANRDDTIIASGYFNFINAEGQANFDHVFISSRQEWPVKETHVAYTDSSFETAISYLRKTFPNKSRFELGGSSVLGYDKSVEERSPKISVEKTSDVGTSTQETSHQTNSPTDEERRVIQKFKEKLRSNEVWRPLIPDILRVEKLMLLSVPGWRKIANDVIRRWKTATHGGQLSVAVTEPRSDEVNDLLSRVGHLATRMTPTVQVNKESQGSSKPKCSRCQKNREQRKDSKTVKGNTVTKKQVIIPHERQRTVYDSEYSRQASHYEIKAKDACQDCAIEHLAKAVAYLSSDGMRPLGFEFELARGEFQLATGHLLALNRLEEYNRCIELLDGIGSENSVFTAENVKEILKNEVDARNKKE